MAAVKFRGWIYWAGFTAYCGFVYAALIFIKGTIPFLIALAIPLIPIFVADAIERRNLFSYLELNHHDKWVSVNDGWYPQEWNIHKFIFSCERNDDPELLLHKRNNRHVRLVTIAMFLAFVISDFLHAALNNMSQG